MLLALLASFALADTWHNGNVDLPETLGEIMTVGYAGQIQITAKTGAGGTVTFAPQSFHAGACAEGRDTSGLRYTACLKDGDLEVSISGGDAIAVSTTIMDKRGDALYSSALTEARAVQRENTRVRR